MSLVGSGRFRLRLGLRVVVAKEPRAVEAKDSGGEKRKEKDAEGVSRRKSGMRRVRDTDRSMGSA